VRSLSCEAQPGDGRLIVRTGDGQSITDFFYETVPLDPLNLPGNNTEVIGEIIVPAQGAVSISTIFTPNIDNTFLRIANATETPGRSFMTIDQAKVTCETSAIEDIIITQVGATVNFEAVNSSPFAFTAHGWDFGDGNSTGGAAIQSHIYDQPGDYTVCLNIFDINKCCGELCKTFTVNPPPNCPVDEETIFIDADVTSNFSDLVAMGIYSNGGSITEKDIVIKGAFTLDVKL
jgi:PKD repeat protein